MVNERFYDMFTKPYDFNPTCGYTLGPGCAAKVGEKLAMYQRKKAFIITGRTVRSLGYTDLVAKGIAACGIEYEIYDDTEVNPSSACVHRAFDYMKGKGFDVIVAVGGGSVMDTAKGVKHLCGNPDMQINDIAMGPNFQYRPRRSPVLLFTVPTMNGTGCELSAGAVITSPVGTKDTCLSGDTAPDFAFIDPNFSIGLPAKPTIAAACDAIAHGFNKLLITDGIYYMQNLVNVDLIKILLEVVPKALAKPDDVSYRSAIALATAMPMFYSGNKCWGHAYAHTITHYFGTSHGIACAWVQPAVLRRYLPKCTATTVQLAEMLGLNPNTYTVVDDICNKMIEWYKSIGIPSPADSCDYDIWMKMGPDVPKDSFWHMAGGNYPATVEEVLVEAWNDFA